MKRTSLPLQRREFITLLGGAAAAWPLAARAQQPAMPVIGFLDVASAPTGRLHARVRARPRGDRLYRGPERGDRISLGGRPIRSLTAAGGRSCPQSGERDRHTRHHRAALAAKAATATIPIVFGTGDDPVKLGLVASLNHPGGNATGVSMFGNELVAKRLQLLRDLAPAAKRVAVLVNPTDKTNNEPVLRDLETAAIGLQILLFEATTGREIDAAFERLVSEKAEALFLRQPLSSALGASRSPSWRHATSFLQPSPRAILSKLVA